MARIKHIALTTADPAKTAAAHRGDYFTLGDMGYMDAEGYLFLTDRTANLIISGGVNIYPAEVDAVLLEHPADLDAVTWDDGPVDLTEIALSGTRTSRRLIRAWSVGMLKVHIYSSIRTPALFAGTRKQVMPRASPSLPLVRANSAQ